MGVRYEAVALFADFQEHGLNQILGPMFVAGQFQGTVAQGRSLPGQQIMEAMGPGHGCVSR